MIVLNILVFAALFLSSCSPTHDRSAAQVKPETETDQATSQIIDPASGSGNAPASFTPDGGGEAPVALKPEPVDDEIASNSNHGTGVGNGSSEYSTVWCGVIRLKDESYGLYDWSGKLIARLTLSDTQKAQVPSGFLRACIVHSKMPNFGKQKFKVEDLEPREIYPSQADQDYLFEVFPLPGSKDRCLEEVEALEIPVKEIFHPRFGDPYFQVSMPDTAAEKLTRLACVMMIRIIR